MSLQKVATNYYAELTPEEFREVQSTLRNLGEHLHKS